MALQWQRDLPEAQGSKTVKSQEKELWRSPPFTVGTRASVYEVRISARWDDHCGNGSNAFYAAFDVVLEGGMNPSEYVGVDDVPKAILAQIPPHIADLKKWSGCHPFGPWPYIENTVYHAGNKDRYGLLKGEKRQLVNGRSGLPAWHLMAIDEEGNEIDLFMLPKSADSAEQPPCPYRIEYRPWWRIGEGKIRELDYARSTAIWPEATEDQLIDENLATALKTRLPGLLVEFRKVIESLGFVW